MEGERHQQQSRVAKVTLVLITLTPATLLGATTTAAAASTTTTTTTILKAAPRVFRVSPLFLLNSYLNLTNDELLSLLRKLQHFLHFLNSRKYDNRKLRVVASRRFHSDVLNSAKRTKSGRQVGFLDFLIHYREATHVDSSIDVASRFFLRSFLNSGSGRGLLLPYKRTYISTVATMQGNGRAYALGLDEITLALCCCGWGMSELFEASLAQEEGASD
mmetsp:Transcript_43196/g.112025  ORF Transcript_43196/g.112025 Transcript_43196/m.112025 type:complete len:218 (-) Transcript_43196:814-1467(-)